MVHTMIKSYLYHGMYHILKEWKQVVCFVLLPLSWYVPYTCTKGMETSDVCCSLTFIMVCTVHNMIKVREQNTPLVSIPLVYGTYHDKGKRTKHITVSIPLVYGTYHDKGKRTKHTTCFHSFSTCIWYIP
jgi:hypothetical protein